MLRSLPAAVAALCVMAECLAAATAQTKDMPQKALEVENAQGIEKIGAYAGSWTIHIEHLVTPYSNASDEHTQLRNDCWKSGRYFACNQYIDGVSKALIVFTFDPASGSYTTYPIPTDGSAAGSGRLEIQGNVWTFPWETKDGDKTTYLRVVNVFTAPDMIQYRQEFSTDKVNWTLMGRGEEKKIAGPPARP